MPDSFNFTPNLPGMTYGGYPPELQQEAQKLARQQAIADAMLARNMQPGPQGTQMVSGIAVRNSPLAGINQMLAPYLGQYVQEGLDKERTALGEKYSTQLGAAVRDYTQRTTGTPEIAEPPVELGGGPGRPAMPATDEEKRAAIISAMSSGFGPLQRIAGEDWKQLQKNQLTLKDVGNFMDKFTPDSVQAFKASGGRTPLVKRPEPFAAGDLLLDKNDPNPMGQTGRVLRTFEPPRVIPGPPGQPGILAQRQTETGKETSLGGGGTTVNVDTVGKEGVKAQTKSMTDRIDESLKSAQDAQESLRVVSKASEIFNAGARMGTGTEIRNFIDKALVTAGLKDDKGNLIANTGNMQRVMADLALANTKKLAPISRDELKFLTKMKSGQDATPEELFQLLQMVADSAVGTLNVHNSLVQRMPEHAPGYHQSMMVQSPVREFRLEKPSAGPTQSGQSPSPGLGVPGSLDEAAKAAGGKRL